MALHYPARGILLASQPYFANQFENNQSIRLEFELFSGGCVLVIEAKWLRYQLTITGMEILE